MSDSTDEDLEIGFLERVMKGSRICMCPPPVILSAYAGNGLDAEARKAVREHLSRCAACVGAMDNLTRTSQSVSGDIERAGELDWEALRAKLPLTLPPYRGEEMSEAAFRVSAVKARIAAYRPALLSRDRAPKRRVRILPYAASFVAVVLLAVVILTGPNRGFPVLSPLIGDRGENVVVTASGVSGRGNIEIRQSPLQSPMAVHPVGSGTSKVTMRLAPGVYWMRVVGETSGSRLIPVKVELSGRSGVSIQSEANVVILSPSSPAESLRGAVISYELNGRAHTSTIETAAYELGPLRKDDSLKNLVIEKEGERWRYPGAIRVMGGRQTVEVKLKALPGGDAGTEPAGAGTELMNVIETVEKSTVKIETDLPSGLKGVATGFAVQYPGGEGIMTSFHVIEGASSITVITSTGRQYEAHVLASGRDADLALLDLPPELYLPAVSFGDSSRLKRGQRVFVLGNPLNEDYSVTDGIVSKLKSSESGLRILMLSNRLNPGNSGSPLFLESGEVVGIVSAKLLATSEIDSMGVSLASEEIEKWLRSR